MFPNDLTLTVWSKSPNGKYSRVGERSWQEPTFDEFAAAVREIVSEIEEPDVPSFASCNVRMKTCAGGPQASFDDGNEVEWAIRYLWDTSISMAKYN